jgi:glutathione S-transferase
MSQVRIIGSVTSPFTRTVRVACEELGVAYDFEATPPFVKMSPEHLALVNRHNPLMKVPVLVDGGEDIMDSRVIVEHLLRRHPRKEFRGPENVKETNILTVVYGVLDAGILWFILGTTHPELKSDAGYLARSMERVGHGLAWLDRQPLLGQRFGPTEALLVSGLDWFSKRDIFKWEDLPHLKKVHAAFHGRSSMVKTRIPDNV